MKRKLKGLLALWMTAVLMLGILPGAVLAEEEGDVEYNYNIIIYTGSTPLSSGKVVFSSDYEEGFEEVGISITADGIDLRDVEKFKLTKIDHELVGWKIWKTQGCGNIQIMNNTEPGKIDFKLTKDIYENSYMGTDPVLEPIWEPIRNYKVTLETNGGVIAEGKNVTSYVVGTETKLPDSVEITRENYSFMGWYDNPEFNGDPITSFTRDRGDVTFYAKWEPIKNSGNDDTTASNTPDTNLPFLPFGRFGFASMHTLSFHVNGGDPIDSISRAFGTTVSLAKYVPTREGYNFTGWFTDSTLTKKVEKVVVSGATSLYAGWELIPVEEPAETTEETAAETTAE